MKKITLSILALFFAVGLSAQTHFGIKGGLNFNSLKDVEWKNNNSTGWHAGILLQTKLPLGFAFQPEVLYSVKSFNLWWNDAKLKFNYIEVPLNIQWGIDLIIFRPYVIAAPYFSYLLSVGDSKKEWKGAKSIDYGFGLGVGIDIWKLQVTGKYNWGFGNLGDIKSSDWKVNDSKLQGLQLSLGFLF